ncbi:MAG TPA: DUF4175 family protein [Pirellulaceae bacterium]|nr:DUF4175 family protein [Pirellulaceae bacterium]
MSTAPHFVERFDRIWVQARRVQLSQAICWGVLTALAGIALLAALDYWLELSRPLRLFAIGAIGVGAVAVAVSLVVRSIQRWKRGATAATIEHVFPQLGQRIRTTVQYGELPQEKLQESGVAGTLVEALESDTVRLAQPLPLDAVIPWKSLALASLLAAVVGLALAGASALNWEWRAAARRALAGEEAYTKLTVVPGNASVMEGQSLLVEVNVAGRSGNQLLFQSRRTDDPDSEWRLETLPIDDAEKTGEQQWRYSIPLDRIRHPLEYRVSAGSAKTETFRVAVRYPLKIVRISAAVQPPAYTRLPEAIVEGSNLAALVGSKAKLEIELDRAAETAWLEMQALPTRGQPTPPVEKIPLAVDGVKLTAGIEIAGDRTFAVFARSADAMELPENKHRIRARQDEPPRVWFESPNEALEVHTLAEILMRIRVSDDFGLSRAGIMFEVNNEDEYPLLMQDFLEAAEELQTTGTLSPSTRATLEKMLPLEHFQLTQRDSVMYYAFAEDILPGGAQRTETDLRFIDIRPFKRTYRLPPDGEPGENMGRQSRLKSLEELIARQRYALNRAIGLAKKFERSGQADLAGTDSLVKFEGELAKFTHDLSVGLVARGVDDVEMLNQAENAMLAATDSLAAGRYDTAEQQMRDAVKNLIDARDRLEIILRNNRNRMQLAALRNFDRTQQQKIRRPKSDEEEAKQIAQRLEELANEEDFVYATLAGLLDPDQTGKAKNPSQGATGDSEKPAPMPMPGESPMPLPAAGNPAEQPAKAGMTREELEDKQLDIGAAAREIEKALARLPRATDLAKERMTATAKAAEDAGEAIGRGALEDAKSTAGVAREQFRELAQQVRALLADEQADRIAAAQQMAANLARLQEDFVDRLSKPGDNPGLMPADPQQPKNDQPAPGIGQEPPKDPNQKLPGVGAAADKIAEKAKTLADVLGAASRADRPEDEPSAEKVAALAGALDLPSVTERLKNLPGQVREGKKEDARATAGDGAEKMEAAAEQLAGLHRQIVAPRVEELAKLERQVVQLDGQLDELETDTRVTQWHLSASELLDQVDEKGLAKELTAEFKEEMKKAGWGPDLARGRWNWARIDGGNYQAPARYRPLLSRLAADIRQQMQEMLLGDLRSTGDEPIPPQYEEFVDRYYKVLATDGKPGARRQDTGDRGQK